MERPVTGTVECQLRGNALSGWGVTYCMPGIRNLSMVLFPIGKYLGFRNQGAALLKIIPNDSTEDSVLPVPAALSSSGLEVMVPMGTQQESY